ncbi:MAG: hypothetical protein HC888_10130 [Candidatus Competibacteraceae bacterium]|nr:hypothetical protein [Candidatus Competibacteraceae bacterium]
MDWTTFNSKESVITFDAPLSRTINNVSCVDANGSTKGCLTAADWTNFNAKEAVLSFSSPLSRTGNNIACLVASGGQSGCLSSTDWAAFNSKEAALTFSAFFDRTGNNISLASAASNLIVATPDGSAGPPSTRAMVANDVPSLPASKIGSGLLSSARGGTNADLSASTGMTKVVAGTFTTATPGSDYLEPSSLQAGIPLYCRSVTGNDTYTCSLSPALTVYTRGMLIYLDPDAANAGAASLNINGLGAISILKFNGTSLSDNDITSNRGTLLFYNGTSFNVIGDGGGSGSGDVVGPASSTSGNVVSFNGTTGKLIQDSGKALPSGAIVGTTDAQILEGKTITTPVLSSYTVATLPAAGTVGRVAVVTDGTSAGDCVTGGGSSLALCR